ncbi:hypothetical protein NQ315_011157 [Exocentrus adspersus]|uniref:Uncharacterized protein n=1 Tax=Exocentrus adspersus TaxID=1586481 RepID=A0AAV8VZ31_9CUCU|nr:hypothetical protein NQ315_011157 [Exocentrus adspersus]
MRQYFPGKICFFNICETYPIRRTPAVTHPFVLPLVYHNLAIISREVLDREYSDRWIGKGGPVAWPARSPDLTPLDFCLWGSIKEKVYQDVPTTPENMMERIRNAWRAVNRETLIQCHESFMRRIDKGFRLEYSGKENAIEPISTQWRYFDSLATY